MHVSSHLQNKIEGQTGLLFRFVYLSSALAALFGIFCIYPLKIYGPVPVALFLYGVFNLLIVEWFKKNGNLKWAAVRVAAVSLLVTFTVILFSGGINSPFIFILGVIVLGGYAGARMFGKVYLFAVMGGIFLIYLVDEANFSVITDKVPFEAKHHFSLLSVLFAVYLVGGIFGRNILKTHQAMKISREELEKRVEEKQMLLREVHHRVKNNLQTVSSLLSLQGKNADSEKIRPLIESSKNRVNSMAMIHEMLYMTNDISRIELRPYVEELTENLMQSSDSKNKWVDLDIQIPPVQLGIDTVIPLGLLINEAVTNSLKYGFSEGKEGRIDISLTKGEAQNYYVLEIGDNGIGFSEDLDFRSTNSLGLKLIHNLGRQLRGSVKRIESARGTRYRISFCDFNTKQESPGQA
ncbi:MAG: sensor histidine kinase [Pricia sp.]